MTLTPSQIQSDTQDAIEHIDAPLARRLLRDLGDAPNVDPQIVQALQIVNFADLSDTEAATIMKNRVLDFFALDIPFDDRIEARYIAQGNFDKNKQREILKKAFLENTEMLGPMTLGQWARLFDKNYASEERDERAVADFFLKTQEVETLPRDDKVLLKNILYTYDQLLSENIIDIYDIAAIQKIEQKRSGVRSAQSQQEASEASQRPGLSRGNVSARGLASDQAPTRQEAVPQTKRAAQMSLTEILTKYPNVKKQSVTSIPLVPHGADEPIPGTVHNWIRAYHDTLGPKKHGTMERGNFLFNDTNTKRLEPPDRQRLGMVLKSLDEENPLTINADTGKIVFKNQKKKEERIKNKEARQQAPQHPLNKNADSFVYNTKHKLPIEQKLQARNERNTQQEARLRPSDSPERSRASGQAGTQHIERKLKRRKEDTDVQSHTPTVLRTSPPSQGGGEKRGLAASPVSARGATAAAAPSQKTGPLARKPLVRTAATPANTPSNAHVVDTDADGMTYSTKHKLPIEQKLQARNERNTQQEARLRPSNAPERSRASGQAGAQSPHPTYKRSPYHIKPIGEKHEKEQKKAV